MKKATIVFGVLAIVAGILAVPYPESEPQAGLTNQAFVWNQDEVWDQLENLFRQTRESGCDGVGSAITESIVYLRSQTANLNASAVRPDDPVLDRLEVELFETAARVAACPQLTGEFAAVVGELRTLIKELSLDWDISSPETRHRLYRLLYGSRSALEEVLAQSQDTLHMLQAFEVDPGPTPSAMIHGVRIHSGDILVSRGGYPTSALISRGSDFPGNFSHVALVHVSEGGEVSVIEAHIEVGVTVATAEKYLADKKLRLMVLRLRQDLPEIVADPGLPHEAAEYALSRARLGHIPYDFSMDYQDSTRLFCSEVASDAYRSQDIDLWMGISTISSPGLRSWLSAFGVRHFETQEPSDLEYDPQVRIVAEWRDHATLLSDRIDNSVVDAMLEGAEKGDRLGFPWYQLPAGRLAKVYSAFVNTFGGVGPVPEGMSAASALRNKSYTETHRGFSDEVAMLAERFRDENGYNPPYWQLVEIARQVVNAN